MKKIISIIAVCLITTICLFSLSCEKNTNNECSTCNSDEFVKVKVNLLNNVVEFKKYDDKLNNFHLGLTTLGKNDFNFLTKELTEKTDLNFNPNEIVGFCLITNNSNKDNYIVEKKDILGILLYTLNHKNKMVIKFAKKEDNKYLENKLSNIQIGCITTNNIFDLSTLFFDKQSKMVYLVTGPNYKVDEKSNNKEIDDKLDKLKATVFSNKLPPKTCGLGCNSNNGSRCALGNSGNFFCKEDENCPKDEAEKTLVNANIFSYNYKSITEDLYYFRSNYLKENEGGQKIIDDYYYLGKNLPISFYTIDNCKNLFNLLDSDVIKIINDLAENPNSDTILINDELKTKLTNYLLEIKNVYPDNASKEKIDYLIAKLVFFSNKSNDFITKNLKSY